MREVITLAWEHGGTKPTMLSGPDKTEPDQRNEIKKLRSMNTHEKYERVELWSSNGGRVKQVKLSKPEAKPTAPAPKPAPAGGPPVPKPSPPAPSGAKPVPSSAPPPKQWEKR